MSANGGGEKIGFNMLKERQCFHNTNVRTVVSYQRACAGLFPFSTIC